MREIEAALHPPALTWFNSYGSYEQARDVPIQEFFRTNWANFSAAFREEYKIKDDINTVRWSDVFRQHVKEEIRPYINNARDKLHTYFLESTDTILAACTPNDVPTAQNMGIANVNEYGNLSPAAQAVMENQIRNWAAARAKACIEHTLIVVERALIRDFILSGVCRPDTWQKFVELKAENKSTLEIVRQLDITDDQARRNNARTFRNAKGIHALSLADTEIEEDEPSIYDTPVDADATLDRAVNALNALKTRLHRPGNPFTRHALDRPSNKPAATGDAKECRFCKSTAHRVRDCPKRKAITCNYCKKKGHTEKECRKKKKDAAPASANGVAANGQPGGQPPAVAPPHNVNAATADYGPAAPYYGTAMGNPLNFNGEL